LPEPFKNFFNPTLIAQMGEHLHRAAPTFDAERFVALACRGLDDLELKQRSAQIQAALGACLPEDFPGACELMIAALHPEEEAPIGEMSLDEGGIRGWAVMPMADWVAEHGVPHFDLAMDTLMVMTRRFSAEFAIRTFLLADPERALATMKTWARHDNVHVRRLASEGCRPRLPWGVQLPRFIEDPAPVLELLELLKDDPEEYVRRSVANNLNDISKDHPDLLATLAERWLRGAGRDRKRLVRHACRTSIKKGHRPTLRALGYGPPAVELVRLALGAERVRLGQGLDIEVELRSTASKSQELLLDYLVHHRLASGRTSPKVFKWKTLRLAPGAAVTVEKRHPIKPITTRTYYSGTHHLEIQLNGEVLGRVDFELEA
jgi:3-methyladenine DNA glycosylase AlkC